MEKNDCDELLRLMPAEEWRSRFGATVFRTKQAWEWFKRDHRRQLVEAGALFLGAGRSQDMVDVDRIAVLVRRIRHDHSIARVNRAVCEVDES